MENNWISVKDRMPQLEKGVLPEYLCCNIHGKMFVLWYDNLGGYWVESTTRYDKCHYWPITHWQPLPEPPKQQTP